MTVETHTACNVKIAKRDVKIKAIQAIRKRGTLTIAERDETIKKQDKLINRLRQVVRDHEEVIRRETDRYRAVLAECNATITELERPSDNS